MEKPLPILRLVSRGPRLLLRARTMAILIGLSLSIVLITSFANGQGISQGGGPSTSQVERPPLPHLYMHFLLYQNHLDKAAMAHENQGKDGAWLRDHFEKELGFTPAQFAVVRSTAIRLESELKEIQNRAVTIAQADRRERERSESQPNASVTPNLQLRDLTKERDALLEREIAKLDETLGDAAAVRLRDYIATKFALNVQRLNMHAGSRLAKLPSSPQQGLRP